MLTSSMHHTVQHSSRFRKGDRNIEKRKPEIISYYNSTKCGVNLIDMKFAVFSSNRRTRRWPLAILYILLSIGSVNSYIMYMSFKDISDKTRFDFIKSEK